MIIILEKDWDNPFGGFKKAGTEIEFHSESEQAKQIVDNGIGYPKLALPDDLPAKSIFEKEGFDSLQSLRELESDWQSVKGIGKKTSQELDNYFIKQRENNG